MSAFGGVRVLVACFCLTVGVKCLPLNLKNPEQVHLSATGVATEMVVTWNTFDLAASVVHFGPANLSRQATGSSSKFVNAGILKRSEYVHRVKLTGLMPGAKYVYQCGSSEGWSPLFNFRALRNGTDWSPRLAIYGDMGLANAQSLGRLQTAAQEGTVDAIIHVGDFAYDMDSADGLVGDEFMRKIEPVAAYIPYMTVVGNHENANNFSNYKNRFTMPLYGKNQNLWYSWNLGPAHFIVFSSEVYFFTEDSKETKVNQLKWLTNDLKVANLPQNRAKHPWIVTLAHRPMYCSTTDADDCDKRKSILRDALEDLLYENGVDLEIWAHEHNYERLWPVYREKVYNGSMEKPYTNPKAPVHIITGSAGCSERHTNFVAPMPWDAFRAIDYGFTTLQVINNTHLAWQQVSDDQKGKVIDKVMLIKEKHGVEAWL